MKKTFPKLTKKNIVIIAIVVFVIACSIPYMNRGTESSVSSNTESSADYTVDHRKESIEKFISDFNNRYPEYSLPKASSNLGWKQNIHNDKKQNIEIIVNHDSEFTITVDTYEDRDDMGKLFTALLSMFVNEDKLDGVWEKLINYTEEEMKYEDTELSYNDSGDVEVYGRSHFKWAKIKAKR